MTPAQVRRKALTIKKQRNKLDEAEKILQQECQHLNRISKREGSTGNWDRSEDCYWINHYCPDCDKRWIEDQ